MGIETDQVIFVGTGWLCLCHRMSVYESARWCLYLRPKRLQRDVCRVRSSLSCSNFSFTQFLQYFAAKKTLRTNYSDINFLFFFCSVTSFMSCRVKSMMSGLDYDTRHDRLELRFLLLQTSSKDKLEDAQQLYILVEMQ